MPLHRRPQPWEGNHLECGRRGCGWEGATIHELLAHRQEAHGAGAPRVRTWDAERADVFVPTARRAS